jgi:ElaB/YqjD/DUF883 family membrane-anchored ribosome-binding protein
MARNKQFKLDAPRPLYAVVGAGDLAVKYARSAATDVQTRFAKIDLEPNTLREQARTAVASRVEEARSVVGARVDEFNKDARALPSKMEALLNEAVAEMTETYSDLASRGEKLLAQIRGQQSTQQAKAAAHTTIAKARTTKTQTGKSAKSTAETTKRAADVSKSSAKRTDSTARSGAKSTTTAAKRTASNAAKAAGEGAEKVGE